MSSIQPDYYIEKCEWKSARTLLKLTATLTPQMDKALTALIEGNAEVSESWGNVYESARKRGISIDYPPIPIILASRKDWETTRTLLRQAGNLTPRLDMCLTALVEGKAELRELGGNDSGVLEDDIPF